MQVLDLCFVVSVFIYLVRKGARLAFNSLTLPSRNLRGMNAEFGSYLVKS